MSGFDCDSYDPTLKGPAMLPTTNLRELEHLAIRQALAKCGGNRTHAARELGISLRSLLRKIAENGSDVLKPVASK